ncbi:MAG: LuxR family transcriptional regulator [Alphaproteobacteria bacterium]|jgi:DNA-binding CsgD family transcriptional regulator|nr:LuxR family transcriptional regulator [Alphaproteobacteria bacterium]
MIIVKNFVEELKDLNDIDSMSKLFFQYLDKYIGRCYVAYLNFDDSDTSDFQPIYKSNYPKEWIEYYLGKNLFSTDPVVKMGVKEWEPFLWEKTVKTKEDREFFDISSKFGISLTGMSIPVISDKKRKGLISIYSYLSEEEWGKVSFDVLYDLQIMSIYFHQIASNFINFKTSISKVKLTQREKECLKWISIGKTYWEISKILDIKERTVSFHMNNVKSKLGVYSNTHAVAKALLENIL